MKKDNLLIVAASAVIISAFLIILTISQQQTISTLTTELVDQSTLGTQLSDSGLTGASDLFADWQTYTNQNYGYQFQYPKDWILDNRGTTDLLYSYQPPEIQVKDPNFWNQKAKMDIVLIEKNIQQTFEQWLDQYANSELNLTTPKFTVTTFQSQPAAIEVTDMGQVYLIYKNNSIYHIAITGDINSIAFQTAHKVLSTFKFFDNE